MLFVKIDVEGYEMQALGGMKTNTLRRTRHLMLETSPKNYDTVMRTLSDLALQPVDVVYHKAVKREILGGSRYYNILFINKYAKS